MTRGRGSARRRVGAAVAAAVCVCALSGCAAGQSEPGADVVVRVAAAASLQGVFDEIAVLAEREHPGLEIAPVVYDGSATLAAQLVEGAPYDVFAAANEQTMRTVVAAGRAGTPEPFATNTLVIGVPDGNPRGIRSLRDLADPSLAVVLCAPEVPCGATADALLALGGVQVEPASIEQNVTAVLAKLATGEADAGLVYATDTARADIDAVTPARSHEVATTYVVATTTDGASAGAQAFVNAVLSAQGQRLLRDAGFGAP